MSASTIPTEQSRYIPLTVAETVALCAHSMPPELGPKMHRFGNLLSAWYHHEFLHRSQALQLSYEADTDDFAAELNALVQDANFESITQVDLDAALKEESIFRLRLAVDFSAFEEIVFYRRGPSLHRANIKEWFGLRRQEIEFTNYDLVLVYVRFTKDFLARPGVQPPPDPRLLKLFKNVPKADLEMLFPNTEVRMRLLDKLLIGIPAFISGIAMVTTKVGATLLLLGGAAGFWLGLSADPVTLDQKTLIALITAATALGGYLWKQYSNFKNRKIRFMKTLTESLYFKSVADNEGVITHLLDRAEQAETKEALLAYTALVVNGPLTEVQIAAWVEAKLDHQCRFDVQDALQKLGELSLLEQKVAHLGDTNTSSAPPPNLYVALPLGDAHRLIDQRWDALFDPQ